MIRITKPEKWKDTFFLNLKPIEKLVFIYLYENCDDAGFFDINFNKIVSEIGISHQDISVSLKSLEKTFLTSIDSDKIWIKKFLLHQNRLPLDLKTSEGNFIKLQIENNISKFSHTTDFEAIIKNVKKKTKTKTVSEFIIPKLDEVIDYFKNTEWASVNQQEIINIYDYYESVGWKVGRKNMVDWKKSFIGCFRRNSNNKKGSINSKQNNLFSGQTRMEMIIEGNKQIENFDYNTLKNN